MANFSALKTAIQNAIKQNGNEEITGDVLQQILMSIVSTMGDGAINTIDQNLTQLQNTVNTIKTNVENGYVYAGIATPSTTPVSGKVFYAALQAGTYTNFGGTAVTEGITILKYNGTSWTKEQVLFTDGGVFDISAYHATGGTLATYADLSAALGTNGANVPANVRKGGMSVKYVQSSDNKYVQYLLTKSTWSASEADWEKINLEKEVIQLQAEVGLCETIIGYKGLYEESGYIDSSNVWIVNNSSSHFIIPITGGDIINVISPVFQLAFLKGYRVPEDRDDPDFCVGTSRIVGVSGNNYTAPADAQYLYLIASYNDTPYQYSSIKINGFDIRTDIISRLNEQKNEIQNIEEKFGKKAIFNGVDSYMTFNPLILKDDGDYIEIEYETTQGDTSVRNSFGQTDVNYRISIALSEQSFGVRLADETWAFIEFSLYPETKGKILIKFEEGKIKGYRNGSLIGTYTNTDNKQLCIGGFGHHDSYGYWKGSIGKIVYKIGEETFSGYVDALGGAALSNVDVVLNEVNTSQKQPNITIIPSENNIKVYFNIHDNLYGWLSVGHVVNANAYMNLWRINSDGNYASHNNGVFSDLGIKLLNGAENEFAIRFADSADYSGGFHGNEKIDADESCYCVFVIDGNEYDIDDIKNVAKIECNTFSYRQRAAIYFTPYNDTSVHTFVGYHVKETEFVNGGYVTKNYFELDYTSIGVWYAFMGLVCISKDISDYVIGDDGVTHTTSHPSETVVLSNDINKCSKQILMGKSPYSCIINSKLIGTNMASLNEKNLVLIMDRSLDEKYYSYLIYNTDSITMNDGDAFKTQLEVRFNIATN